MTLMGTDLKAPGMFISRFIRLHQIAISFALSPCLCTLNPDYRNGA